MLYHLYLNNKKFLNLNEFIVKEETLVIKYVKFCEVPDDLEINEPSVDNS